MDILVGVSLQPLQQIADALPLSCVEPGQTAQGLNVLQRNEARLGCTKDAPWAWALCPSKNGTRRFCKGGKR